MAHPRLREVSRGLWEHLAEVVPQAVTNIAAVHLRERTLSESVAALVRQLSLPRSIAGPKGLVAAIAKLPSHH